MPFVSFKNKKIHYITNGRGDSTVVLLHGFLENLSMWKDVENHLENTHKIISIDLLGHGKTDGVADVHTMPLMAEAVKQVLDNENIKKCKVIGHSMGGYVALALAEKHPTLVKQIVLLNSTFLNDSETKKEDRLRAVEALKQNRSSFINQAIPHLFAEQNREKFSEEINEVIEQAKQTSIQGITAALLGMRERKDYTQWVNLSNIKIDILIGEQDEVIALQPFLEYFENSKGETHLFKNSGHMLHIEDTKKIILTIKKLINN